MDANARIEEFDVRVKRIRTHSNETAFTIFDAVILEWRPRRKEWIESKRRVVCIGYFYIIVENDHLHIQAEAAMSKTKKRSDIKGFRAWLEPGITPIL